MAIILELKYKKVYICLMKKYILLCCISLISCYSFSQSNIGFDLKISSKKIIFNNVEINKNTTKADIVKLIGLPNRTKSIGGTERYLIFDSLGLSVELNKETSNVSAFIICYNWDEDEKMAKMKYSGSLMIDDFILGDSTTSNEIKKNTTFSGIMCIGEVLCMTKPGEGVNLLIGYNKTQKITQIGFGCPQ